MGAFFLFRKNAQFDEPKVRGIFKQMHLQQGVERELGEFCLWQYQKAFVKESNYLEENGVKLCAIGTMIYKGLPYKDSLQRILNDVQNNCFVPSALKGHFHLLIIKGEEFSIYTDPLIMINLFYDEEKVFLSSSFLAILFAHGTQNVALNKNAIIEILATGGLMGSATQVNSIYKVTSFETFSFPGVRLKKAPVRNESHSFKTTLACIEAQAAYLQSYFKEIETFARNKTTGLGLTGGLDSRLLTSLAWQTQNKYDYFTFARETEDMDISIARSIAKALDEKLTIIPLPSKTNQYNNSLKKNLEEAFFFNDGQIRMQNYWIEPYNSFSYNERIHNRHYLNINGIAGEQYRNFERIIIKNQTLKGWIKNGILSKISDRIFISGEFESDFIDQYANNIRTALGFSGSRIDQFAIKRYHNEIWNTANRNQRMNNLSRLIHFIAPFADPQISFPAYKAIPYLGWGFSLQMALIQKLSAQLAIIPSRYGFNFAQKEPLKNLAFTVFNDLMPPFLFRPIYRKIKKLQHNPAFHELKSKDRYIQQVVMPFQDLGLPFHLEKIEQNKYLANLLIDLGTFLELTGIKRISN
jgi:hypothetical protein